LQYEDLTSNSTYLAPEDLNEVKSDQEEAVAKFEKAQELRKTAATIEDPNDKALALQEAEKLEVEALASQKQVNNSLRYLENKREIAQQTKSEGTMDSEKVQEINKYYEEADNLYTEAKWIRIFATTDDLEEQAAVYRTADALEQQALETQQTAINLHELYKTDVSGEVPAGDARYMVKIGEFGKDVPVDEATTFFAIKDLGIEVHNIDDKAIYTVGEFVRYEDAEELRIEVESEGIENSSVVVFQDGIILSVEEYLKNTLDSDTE
jgi:tetratricopeptide (TPR) repeat protein